MADKVCPGDLLKTTELVGFALKTRHVPKATGRMQVLICETLIAPLVVDIVLRDGLRSLAEGGKGDPEAQAIASAWLLKLVGAEPL